MTLNVADFYHEGINHSKQFGIGKNHINGIENFWNQAKRVLRKYNGIDCKTFPLFLKDEKHSFARFRFDYGSPKEQLKNTELARKFLKSSSVLCQRKSIKTTNSYHNRPVYNNLLEQQFCMSIPNQALVSDITYV